MRPDPGRRSLVVGAGMGGIAAAAALCTVSDEVVIVERDTLPALPAVRRGVPQGAQLHNLLTRAQIHLEELLPGFAGALERAGCGTAQVARQTHVFELGFRMPERDLGMVLRCAPRPVIEHVARSLLLAQCRVAVQERTRVTGLVLSDDGAIAGAVTEATGRRTVVPAAIVVDATGTTSAAPRWLEAVGRATPPRESSHPDQWYSTVTVERPVAWNGDPSFWLTFATPPLTRSGLVAPVSPGHWHVSLSGGTDDAPCRTFGQMIGHAESLEDPAIGIVLQHARPTSSPKLFRKTTTWWRHYELLPDPVPGFLPIGDAIATLNPLFGQGISVAAWQASELACSLRPWVCGQVSLADATRSYHRRAALACTAAWSLGDMVDSVATASTLEVDAMERRQALGTKVRQNPEVHRHYVNVWHLMEPVSSLVSPCDEPRPHTAASCSPRPSHV